MKNKNNLRNLILLISCVAFSSCENYVEDEYMAPIQECNPDISFTNTIKPIIDSNCISCHNGTQFPDLRTYQGVSANSEIVKNQVVNRTMPIGGTLSNEEINSIECWVESGSLNN